MIPFSDVGKYHRKERGKNFSFYALDTDIYDVIQYSLPTKYAPYSLFCMKQIGELFEFMESPISEFMNLREEKFYRFYLRSLKLTPDFQLPSKFITPEMRTTYEQYFLLNGLICFLLNALEQRSFGATFMIHIDKFGLKGHPNEIFFNREYSSIYKELVIAFNKRFEEKSKIILKDETVVAESNDMTRAFAQALIKGDISSNVSVK